MVNTSIYVHLVAVCNMVLDYLYMEHYRLLQLYYHRLEDMVEVCLLLLMLVGVIAHLFIFHNTYIHNARWICQILYHLLFLVAME